MADTTTRRMVWSDGCGLYHRIAETECVQQLGHGSVIGDEEIARDDGKPCPACLSEAALLLVMPPGCRSDGHGGWWAPVDLESDDVLPADPRPSWLRDKVCGIDSPYEPEGSRCTAAPHGLDVPHISGDSDHVVAVWWEPGHEPAGGAS